MTVYGYCRVSTKKQSIDRQVTNIKAEYPDAVIVKEAYTGTKIEGRRGLDKIIKAVKAGDVIVFDSVSRMSRNAEEGFDLYKRLFAEGVDLVFLKERHVNTETYKTAIAGSVAMNVNTGDDATDALVNGIQDAVNAYILRLAERQIILAFEQSEKEVTDLQQRTREGLAEVKRQNADIIAGIADGQTRQIGAVAGRKLITKKSIEAKKQIRKYSKDFDGMLTDADAMKQIGIARNTYFKYKREIFEDLTK